MIHGRAFALAVAGATLLVALPAAADTSTPPAAAPAAAAPAAPAAAPPSYPPGAYPAPPPGAYPAPPGTYYVPAPGAYPPGVYPPGAYPAPPPGAYYAPPGAYYAPPGYYAPLGPPPPPMERRSPGAMIGGIVGVSAGAILLAAALFEATIADACSGDNGFTQTCPNNTGAVVGLTVAGLVGVVVGIPLIIYGAKKVPVGTASALLPGGTPPSPLPRWAGAPGGTGWKWQF